MGKIDIAAIAKVEYDHYDKRRQYRIRQLDQYLKATRAMQAKRFQSKDIDPNGMENL